MSASSRFDNELRYRAADHPQQTQLTPDYILGPVRQAMGGTIDFDPCTTADNPCGAGEYVALPDDGLIANWPLGSIWVNPPYGKAREPWVDRCIAAGEAGAKVGLLIPSHTDTRVFQGLMASADWVLFVKGRVKFGVLRPNRRQQAASHPSAIFGWNFPGDTLTAIGTVVPLAREAA